MKQLVSFGEALIDFLAEARAGSSGPTRYLCHAGGAPANVAVAAARLGVPAAYVGMLAEDSFGDFLLQSLKEAGVSTDYVVHTAAANTALAFISLDALGDRHFSFYRPPAADLLFRPEHFAARCFATAGIFHFCSNSLTEAPIAAATLEGVRRAQAAGALVNFDLNWRAELWARDAAPHARIWPLLEQADTVKLSAEECAFLAEPLGGVEALLDKLWGGRAQWLLITDGAGPFTYHTRRSRGVMPVFEVRTINTTGAGDAFVGGILSSLLREQVDAESLPAFLADTARVEGVLRFAAACGALAVTRHGPFESMPTRAEVDAFLQGRV